MVLKGTLSLLVLGRCSVVLFASFPSEEEYMSLLQSSPSQHRLGYL